MKDRQKTGSWYRRFAIAAALLCGAVVALLAAVVIIAPKVINSEEVRLRIEAVMAKELHGTITIDRVELSLLPRPDVVLHGFSADIPGTLSATITAVRVHARLLPLFRGQFAVSSIALEQPELTLLMSDDTAGRRSRKPPEKQPAGGSFDKALAIASRDLPDLTVTLSRGKINLVREGRNLMVLEKMDASLSFVSDRRKGPAYDMSDADYAVAGTARATLTGTTALPAPLKVSIDRFDATPGRLTVKGSRVRIQDLDASVSGDFKGYLTGSPRSDIQARGTIGPDGLAWLQSLAGLPEGVSFRAPLTFSAARLRSSGTGSATERTLAVTAQQKEGDATIVLDARQGPGMFSIDSLHVKDGDSDAVVKFSSDPGEDAASFTGSLSGKTIDRFLERRRPTPGWIKGDLHIKIPRGQREGTAVHGSLEGGQFGLPALNGIPFTIDRFTVLADGATVNLNPVVLSLGQESLQMEGTASFAEGGVALDLDIVTNRFGFSILRALVEQQPKERPAVQGTKSGRMPNVSGSIRLRAAVFVMDRYQADAVDMRLEFGKGRLAVALAHASVCGITLTGSLRTVDSEVEVSLSPQARGKRLDESLPCLFLKDLGVSGSFDLSAQLAGRGTWDTLLRSMGGDFSFAASGGRFQNDQIVKGVIAYLNSTSLLKGSNDKLLKEGVPYETFVLRGTLKDGTLSLSEGAIRGRDLHIATEGNIDLRNGTLALNVLAAPFTRLDRMLGSVPLVKSLVGNALIVVPARVAGTFEHPSVKPLAASSVSKNVTNLMKNAVQAPMKIIDPVVPKDLEGKSIQAQE